MRAFIVFGSASDRHVYERIAQHVEDSLVKVCSSHKTPDMLEELLANERYDCVIAGAGLATHLPGVVASQIVRPVIGVPVNGNYDGLDSLLAILQMPPGVPVLTVGIDAAEEAAAVSQEVGKHDRIVLVDRAGSDKVRGMCEKQLKELGISYDLSDSPTADAVNIVLVPLTAEAPDDSQCCIYVPVQEKQEAADSLKLLELTKRGAWVGTNRGENAAIAAVQMMGGHEDVLKKHRQRMKHDIYAANKADRATYREAGVDISRGNEAVLKMKDHVKATFTPDVLADVGLFGGLYRVPVERYEKPVLVASVDGVGTKVRIASQAGRYESIGQDLVNHCVNDILAQGAQPLFFLDYIASSKLDPDTVSEVVEGIAAACKANGCALIGGETAEMPGVYKPGEHDVVSAVVGIVERDRIIDGSRIRAGQTLIGLPSSGLHTNGYSLARRVLLEEGGMTLSDTINGERLQDALLAVHKSYLKPVQKALPYASGLIHVTGGGLPGNVPRVLPEGLGAELDEWETPEIFRLIQEQGNLDREEMFHVFNMGIGFVIVTGEPDKVMESLRAYRPVRIGTIVKGEGVRI